jgi:hypothetical protein
MPEFRENIPAGNAGKDGIPLHLRLQPWESSGRFSLSR